MATQCKKHGKPREVIYDRKMPNGAVFSIVGCRDCAAAAGHPTDKSPKKQERKENLRRL